MAEVRSVPSRRRVSRSTPWSREVRRRLAEHSVAARVAQSPTILAGIVERFDVEELSEVTQELVEIVTEHPVLCIEVGPAAVAEKLNRPDETVRHFRWLELTPADKLRELPALEESLKFLSPEPPLELLGALAQWEEELRRGIGGQRRENPSTWRHDALYVAACHEQAVIEAEREGNRSLARDLIEKAAWALAGDAASHRRTA
jgi:hypothetical protein